jgi:hypothetical protein
MREGIRRLSCKDGVEAGGGFVYAALLQCSVCLSGIGCMQREVRNEGQKE